MFFFDEEEPYPFIDAKISREGKSDSDYALEALADAYSQLRREFIKLVPSAESGNLGFYIEHNMDRTINEGGFVTNKGYKTPYSSYSVRAPFLSDFGLNTLETSKLGLLFRQFSHHLSTTVFNHPDKESHLSKNPLWMTVLWWGTDISRKDTKFGYSFKQQDRFNNSGTVAYGSPSSNVHLWAKELNG